MTEKYEVQAAVYKAAIKYHYALAQYYTAINPARHGQGCKEAADKTRVAAGAYRDTLATLLAYMLSAGDVGFTMAEIEDATRRIDLLDVETKTIRDA